MVLDYQTNKSYITWGILILIGWNAECYKSAYFDAFQILKVFISRAWMEIIQECSEW